jgi:hypothetical protein
MYVETVVGVTLTAFMLIGVAQLVSLEVKQRHEAQSMSTAAQAAANILERLMPLPWDDLNSETASALQLPRHVAELLDEPQLRITIETVAGGAATKQITVQIDWVNRSGQRVDPIQLTAWRYPTEATP